MVVLEDLHHYATVSAPLLEMGIFDAAFFTPSDRGGFYFTRDLESLEGHQIYAGGAYNGKCLKYSLLDFKLMRNRKKARAVDGLILNPPPKIMGTHYSQKEERLMKVTTKLYLRKE